MNGFIEFCKIAASFILIVVGYFYLESLTTLERSFLGILVAIFYIYYLIDKKVTTFKKSKEYNCIFKKELINFAKKDDFSDGIFLESRVIKLPFPPFINLDVHDLLCRENRFDENGIEYVLDACEFRSGKVKEIQWNNDTKTFNCIIAPHKMTKENKLGSILEVYERHGWILSDYQPEARHELDEWKAENLKK